MRQRLRSAHKQVDETIGLNDRRAGTGSNSELRPHEHLTERAMILTGFRHGVSDITKSVFQIRGVDRDSEVAIRKRVSRAKLLEFFAGLPRCLIGIEACPTAHHWSWKLQALGRTVRLMPPSDVKAYLNRSKNDANDAAAICKAVTRLASNSAIDCPSTPAAPWLAFTRLKASQTSRLGIGNGFALSTGSSRCQMAAVGR